MTLAEIEQIFERVRSRPPERQERAADLLLALEEQGTGVHESTDAELAEIEGAEAQAERGEFASAKEVKALFDRYRR